MWMKIDFAYEKMSTKTRFENEAWGNSEMAYSQTVFTGKFPSATQAIFLESYAMTTMNEANRDKTKVPD